MRAKIKLPKHRFVHNRRGKPRHGFKTGKWDSAVLRVGNPTSRRLFSNACRAHAGDLQCGAIIELWKAVMHDIKAKAQELMDSGEAGQARILVDRIKEAERNKDRKQQQKIEDDLLEVASKMGLLDEDQKKALERLKEMRNKCAHNTEFVPNDWDVEGHLKDALEHLLSQPAWIGKRAVERLLDDMCRKSFPVEESYIWEYAQEKYFKQAKGVFFTNLLKALLRAPFGERREQFKSLEARNKLGIVLDKLKTEHSSIFEEECGPFLMRYLDNVEDKDLLMLSPLFRKSPELWDKMGVSSQIRFKVGVMMLRKTWATGIFSCFIPSFTGTQSCGEKHG